MKQTVYTFSSVHCQQRYAVSKQCKLFTFLAVILSAIFLLSLYYSITSASTDRSGDVKATPSENGANGIEVGVDVQHAVVVDAGSSGSRIYIYVWPPHTGNPHELLQILPLQNKTGHPLVKKIEPGLSSVSANPDKASDYILPLLQFASNNIPSNHHDETPLYILATAGLRLLNSTQQTTILEDLRVDVPKSFNFSFAPNHVEIISGKQEGVYQWVAINYVLERFSHNVNELDAPLVAVDIPQVSSSRIPILFRKQTVGIMDMGGASMQIGFEITHHALVESLHSEQRSNMAEFNLGCTEHEAEHVYRTYVTSYLGLGANEVMEFYESRLLSGAIALLANKNVTSYSVSDPCRPTDLVNKVIQNDVTILIRGTGKFDECRKQLLPLLSNLTGCPGPTCAFTALPVNFATTEWYGFSEFWYSMEDVLGIGGVYNFYKFQKASREYCNTKWNILQSRLERNFYPRADSKGNRLRNQCFKSAWITVVLHEGMGLPLDYTHLRSSPNTIAGQVVHWTLGATLFRTRFFPLGAMQRELLQQNAKPSYSWHLLHLNHYLFIGCFLLVISSILLYLRGLHKRCSHRSSFKPLTSPPVIAAQYDDFESVKFFR